MQAPQCSVILQLVGPGAGAIRPCARNREGSALPEQEVVPAEAPAALNGFPGQPEDRRLTVQIRFTFRDPRPVEIHDAAEETPLLTLAPRIVFPEHVFALMEEARAGFAPDGFSNFVETGTLFGHTTLHASYWVKRAVTLELSADLHAEACRHLAHRPNVTCLHGDSAALLPAVIADLDGPSFFFLDAHWSGDGGTDWESSRFSGYPTDTARREAPGDAESRRQVPLQEELEVIAQNHAAPALVLIDDWEAVGQKDFGFVGEDWSHLDKAKLLHFMESHPRTERHFRADPKRHAWFLRGA